MNVKSVVRLGRWIDPEFDKILAADSSIQLKVLDIRASEDVIRKGLGQAHMYLVPSAKDEVPKHCLVTRELLGQCPNLVFVCTSGAGYDTVDIQACTDAGVLVVNQAGGNADSVAEHAYALMLGVARRLIESDTRMKNEKEFPREDLMGHELKGKIIGLVGLGQVGTRVARIAQAFGMPVLAYDPYLTQAEIAAHGARSVDLDTLLASSDIVSLHCPRTAETTNLIDARAFGLMKRGALFISTARGGIHDERALYAALVSGHLAGAGLDVWKFEPPPLDDPLLGLKNVVTTFHTAGVTHEARRNVATMAANAIVKVSAGEVPDRVVNKDVLPKFLDRLNALSD